jgi:uncharacterized protein YbbC (DUF1343 family)
MAMRIIKAEKLLRLLNAIFRTMNNSRFNARNSIFAKILLSLNSQQIITGGSKCGNVYGLLPMKILLLIIFSSVSSCIFFMPGELMKPFPNFSLPIICGDQQTTEYLPLLKGKHVALMVNQTAMLGKTHLADSLYTLGVDVKKIFAPEHGFRGTADAGKNIRDTIDPQTKIPVISIYGEKKKPTAADLAGIDIVIFDIQDVGARFYTYISSLHYLMEACAENNVELLVLDRPNPNGWYVDGPVLQKDFQSFVGVDPLPIVHGLTIGEYAQMVNGEKWLPHGGQCKLRVIQCLEYQHTNKFSLRVKPSPNLQDSLAIALYPSICMFEGTNISVGRGTDYPFEVIGSPKTGFQNAYEFTPQSKPGATNPPFVNQMCYGYDLRRELNIEHKGTFTFQYIIEMYKIYPDKNDFFLKSNFFDKLAGTDAIKKMIVDGKTEKEIRASYQKDLLAYKAMRKKYLLYPDFE